MSNNTNTQPERKGAEINVAYLIKMILSKWWVILLTALLCGALGFTVAELTKTETYSSQISFVVSNRQTTADGEEAAYSSGDLNASITLANTFKYILSSRTMCERVAQSCSFNTSAAAVSNAISLNTVTGTNIIVMTVTTDTAAKSYDYALAVINNFNDIVENSGYPNSSITVCDPPVAATSANSNTSALMYCLVGAFAGAVLALIIIMIMNMMKNTIQNAEDIHNRLDMRIIGLVFKTIPRGSKSKNKNNADQALLMDEGAVGFSFVETYKAIRTKVENIAAKKGHKVFLISSASENEGKTTVAVNLAIALAQNGHSVLLIDADLRKPAVCKALSLSSKESRGHGLPDVLTGVTTFERAIRYVEKHKIFLLGGSTAVSDPSELLSMPQMEKALRAMRNEFDFVIIDTAPGGLVTDASILSNYADATLLVIREDFSSVERIHNTIDDLSGNKSEMIGCVYNNVSVGSSVGSHYNRYTGRYNNSYAHRRYGYGYSYGYGYGYGYGYDPQAAPKETTEE